MKEYFIQNEERAMLDFRQACKKVFFLFLFVCAPTWMHCEDCNQLNADKEIIECKEVKQGIARKDALDDFMKEKSRKKERKKFSYYLYVQDFIDSFIDIPTSNVSVYSSTISSKYLAGRAPIYNKRNKKVGTCSASFLCMQNADGIFTDISNYLSVDNGLIVSWFTPTTLINLELDSIIHSMVTECIVKASTKIGFNPFYGEDFNMIVSSDDQKIYFKLTKIE